MPVTLSKGLCWNVTSQTFLSGLQSQIATKFGKVLIFKKCSGTAIKDYGEGREFFYFTTI